MRVDDVRGLSACVFGQRHKLELLAALATASEGKVNLSELATANAVRSSVYYPAVKDLISAGLLCQLSGAGQDARRWYQRRGSAALWASVEGLTDELRAAGRNLAPAESVGRA
jgi:hypothetical protein